MESQEHNENNQNNSMIEDKPSQQKGRFSKLLRKCDQLIVIVVSVLIAFGVAYFFLFADKDCSF